MSGSTGAIREQIGRIEAKLDNIFARIGDLRTEAKESEKASEQHRDALWAELRNVKHESRQELHVMTARMDRQDGLLKTLQTTVDSMQEPLQFAITLHRRLGAVGLVVASIGVVAWGLRDILWDMGRTVLRSVMGR